MEIDNVAELKRLDSRPLTPERSAAYLFTSLLTDYHPSDTFERGFPEQYGKFNLLKDWSGQTNRDIREVARSGHPLTKAENRIQELQKFRDFVRGYRNLDDPYDVILDPKTQKKGPATKLLELIQKGRTNEFMRIMLFGDPKKNYRDGVLYDYIEDRIERDEKGRASVNELVCASYLVMNALADYANIKLGKRNAEQGSVINRYLSNEAIDDYFGQTAVFPDTIERVHKLGEFLIDTFYKQDKTALQNRFNTYLENRMASSTSEVISGIVVNRLIKPPKTGGHQIRISDTDSDINQIDCFLTSPSQKDFAEIGVKNYIELRMILDSLRSSPQKEFDFEFEGHQVMVPIANVRINGLDVLYAGWGYIKGMPFVIGNPKSQTGTQVSQANKIQSESDKFFRSIGKRRRAGKSGEYNIFFVTHLPQKGVRSFSQYASDLLTVLINI